MGVAYTYYDYADKFEVGDVVHSKEGYKAKVLNLIPYPDGFCTEGNFEGLCLNNGRAYTQLPKIKFRKVKSSHYNIFRESISGKLNKEYLRYCATRKLFEAGTISRGRAFDLLLCKANIRNSVLDMWEGMLKHPKFTSRGNHEK